MKKLSFKGIIIGGIIDIVSSNILGVIFVAFIMSHIDSKNLTIDQLNALVKATIHGNFFYVCIQFLIGSLCSVLGGYCAAKIAKYSALLNGALSSFICVGIGIYALLFKPDGNHLMTVADIILAPALGLFGGYLHSKRIAKRQ